MKLQNLYILCGVALSLGLTSCSDFLDKQPEDSGTEAIMFKTPAQFESAANNLYSGTFWGWNNIESIDANLDVSGIGQNGGGSVPESDGAWGDPQKRLRNVNILLKKATEYAGNLDEMTADDPIAPSVGTAYFFRAWNHFAMVKDFGGVPIVDHVLDVTDPVLFGARNSRYEVIDLIIKDLKRAVALLPKRTDLPFPDNRGKITREVAQGFLARVALYEGTWEKYTPNIGLDLDGDGVNSGAGKAKPEGYPSVNELLSIAKENAEAVMAEADKGTFALWKECGDLSYYHLFNIDDSDGNPCSTTGAGKATNKEFLWCNPYDYTLKKSNWQLVSTVWKGYCAKISAYLGESFLCTNGLPTHYSTTGDIADVQPNLTGRKVGRKILGTFYTDDPSLKVNGPQYSGTPLYDPETRPVLYGMASETPTDLDYGRPVATLPGNCLWSPKDYLKPIPLGQIRLNENLIQNPEW